MVCSKMLYKEALNHPFDEPKQWEIREINDIMNNSIVGWKQFTNQGILSDMAGRKAGSVTTSLWQSEQILWMVLWN